MEGRARSNGWQSAETTNNPRQLLRGAVSTRVNVHTNGIAMEFLIHDLDAPRDQRWTSITLDRSTGATGIGRHRDGKEAWKLAHADQTK
jgi:hypothetical protein